MISNNSMINNQQQYTLSLQCTQDLETYKKLDFNLYDTLNDLEGSYNYVILINISFHAYICRLKYN